MHGREDPGMYLFIFFYLLKRSEAKETHSSAGGILDGDGKSARVATFSKDVLTGCREGVDPPIKGLKIHVSSH